MAGTEHAPLHAGDYCSDSAFAFVTMCITDLESVLAMCLASICALLATTDPDCIAAIVSPWVRERASKFLIPAGVLMIEPPPVQPMPSDHPYATMTSRSYTFNKFEVFRLTHFKRVAFFDADVLVVGNASALADQPPLALSRVQKGLVGDKYMQTAVMVVEPSLAMYHALVSRWRAGDYRLSFSATEHTEQDVVVEHCVLQGLCGPVHDLDACVWNHGAWLPGPPPRLCDSRAVLARHNFRPKREPALARELYAATVRGTCRARRGRATMGCWGEGFREADCCRLSAGAWGDWTCWGDGFSYERCCTGVDDAAALRAHLRHNSSSWYGITSWDASDPHLMNNHCWRLFHATPLTYAGISASHYDMAADVDKVGVVFPFMAKKCMGTGAPDLFEHPASSVHFNIDWGAYFGQFKGSRFLPDLVEMHAHVSRTGRLSHGLQVCVPGECCGTEGTEGMSAGQALHMILWGFVLEHVLRFPGVGSHAPLRFDEALHAFRRGSLPPLPLPEHFGPVRLVPSQGLCGNRGNATTLP